MGIWSVPVLIEAFKRSNAQFDYEYKGIQGDDLRERPML
jgi:hypothetical protein